MTPPGGEPKRRSGYALTIPSKGQHGRWRLASDAKSRQLDARPFASHAAHSSPSFVARHALVIGDIVDRSGRRASGR